MQSENLKYAQIGEAIRFAGYNTFEYRRLSLILLDNLIENLLIKLNGDLLRHELILGKITKIQFDVKTQSFNKFEHITKISFQLGIIGEMDKNIINYCHKARNNLYHTMFEDERITEFGVLYYCNFIFNNFIKFFETQIKSFSDIELESAKMISKINGINNTQDLYEILNFFCKSQITKPQEILSSILDHYISVISEAVSEETFPSYQELNNTTMEYYKDYIAGDKYKGLNPSGKIKQLTNLNENKVKSIQQTIKEINNQSVEISFTNYTKIILKIEPVYIGLMLYFSEQEYEADLQLNI